MPDLLEEAKRLSDVEALAREFHAIYQAEAKRQGDVRHHDDYDALPENIKEFDRVLARCVLDREAELVERLEQADDLLRRLSEWDMLYVSPEGKPVTADGPYWQAEIKRTREALAAQQREVEGG